MVRRLVVAALFLHATLSAQVGTAPPPNPFTNDPFWTFHAVAMRYAEMQARAKSPRGPADAIEANFAIGSRQGAVRAARGLLTAAPAEFARGARLLIEHSHDLNDDGTGIHREFLEFIGEARKRVETFRGEGGADAASAMLTLEYLADRGNDAAHRQRVEAFRTRFAGTRAAEAMRVSQVDASRMSRDIPEWMRRYRELAREYDGTEVGAMALFYVASRQSNCCNVGDDEVERLTEVFDIVKELESGRFPRSEWVERAPSLVSGFFFGSTARIPHESMPRLYERYLEFVLSHPVITTQTIDGGVEWIVRNAVSRLAPTPIERVSIVEEFLEDLVKRGFGVNDARVLRAKFYFALTDPGWIPEHMKGGLDRKEAESRAILHLRRMIESAQPAAVAQARQMLAGHYFGSGRYAEARSQFTMIQNGNPAAEWSWVAALRIAQIHERLGQKTAVADYEAVALRKDVPLAAALLARVSAAELREAAGALPAAAVHYREALAAWQSLPPDAIHLYSHVTPPDLELPVFSRFADLKKADLITRLERLSKAVTTEETLLYEGRRALELHKPREALAPLRKLVASYPRSSAAVEGGHLLRRAQFAEILSTPRADLAKTDRDLQALAAGPYDSITPLSQLARAALKVRTNAAEAEAITKQALEQWHAKQPASTAATTSLDRDIAAIRVELFRPQGGGIYGTSGGNGFRWPAALSPFQLVSRDIRIKTIDGKEQTYSAPFTTPAGLRAVFVTSEDQAALRLILDRIGGTDTKEWVNPLDLPNQPIGGSIQIAQLWSKFFPLRPGHWGGWELTVYPDITRITFDRDGHALAEVTIGYGGGTYELAKENGKWVAKRMVSMWVT